MKAALGRLKRVHLKVEVALEGACSQAHRLLETDGPNDRNRGGICQLIAQGPGEGGDPERRFADRSGVQPLAAVAALTIALRLFPPRDIGIAKTFLGGRGGPEAEREQRDHEPVMAAQKPLSSHVHFALRYSWLA